MIDPYEATTDFADAIVKAQGSLEEAIKALPAGAPTTDAATHVLLALHRWMEFELHLDGRRNEALLQVEERLHEIALHLGIQRNGADPSSPAPN